MSRSIILDTRKLGGHKKESKPHGGAGRMVMGKFSPLQLFFFLLLLVIPPANIMAADFNPLPPGQNLGDFGFGHNTAHKMRLIEKLMQKTGLNCCQGINNGGECRQTVIRYGANGKKMALLDGTWCALPEEFLRRMVTDVYLGEGIEAYICAPHPRGAWPAPCPTSFYCGMEQPPQT